MDGQIREGTFFLNDAFGPTLRMIVEQRADGFYMQNRSTDHGRGPLVRVSDKDWAALSEAPNGKVW